MPKQIDEGTKEDWYRLWATFGDKTSGSLTFTAPSKPGEYTLSIKVDDFGLVRSNDKGTRDDGVKIERVTVLVLNVYLTGDAAAETAIKAILRQSISEGREYAGYIYKNTDGTYSYTDPNPGTKDASSPGQSPNNKEVIGVYHTHGAADPGYDNEHFSPQDKKYADYIGKSLYLGTPSGRYKKYDPKTGKVTILSSNKEGI